MISFLRIFFGSLLFSICFASECYAESNLTAAVELPYIALENSSKSRIIVVGSAHSKINGILDLGKSTRNLLASVSLVAFEAHPNAPPGAPPHYRVQSYVDRDTLNRLEQLARRDQNLQRRYFSRDVLMVVRRSKPWIPTGIEKIPRIV